MTTRSALGGAVRDARDAWRPLTTFVAVAFGLAAFVPLVVGESRVADLAGGLYLAAAAVGLAFTVGVAGLPLLAQGAFMAIGAVTAAHVGSTALGATAGAAGGRSRRARGRSRVRPAAPGGVRGRELDRLVARRIRPAVDPVAARRDRGNRGRRRPVNVRALRARAPPHVVGGGRLRSARACAVRAAARRGARTRARSNGAAGSDRATADRGPRRVGHVCRPGRSARRPPCRGGRSRLVQPLPLLQALRRRADRRAAVRPRGRGRRARARGAVVGRRRDRLARKRRRRPLAHASRSDHAARRDLAGLGRHRPARQAQAPLRPPARGPTEARRRASRRVGSRSGMATSSRRRTSTSMSRQGVSPPSSARTAPGRQLCFECSPAG